jgi:hypothetical protein
MPTSIHDNYLVSYEVRCKERTIILCTQYDYENSPREFTNVVFTDVQSYRLEDDAFGNIIYGLDEVSVGQILEEHHAQIAESYRLAGAPGPWAADLLSAAAFLTAQGAKGFVLSSSHGLSGWVIAKDVSIHSVQPSIPPDLPDAAPCKT